MKIIIIISMLLFCSICNGQVIHSKNLKRFHIDDSGNVDTVYLNVIGLDTLIKYVPIIATVVDTSHEYGWGVPNYLIDSCSVNMNVVYGWYKGKRYESVDMGMREKLDPYTTMLYDVILNKGGDKPIWEHLVYFDRTYNPLPKNLAVIQTFQIK